MIQFEFASNLAWRCEFVDVHHDCDGGAALLIRASRPSVATSTARFGVHVFEQLLSVVVQPFNLRTPRCLAMYRLLRLSSCSANSDLDGWPALLDCLGARQLQLALHQRAVHLMMHHVRSVVHVAGCERSCVCNVNEGWQGMEKSKQYFAVFQLRVADIDDEEQLSVVAIAQLKFLLLLFFK